MLYKHKIVIYKLFTPDIENDNHLSLDKRYASSQDVSPKLVSLLQKDTVIQ